MFPEIPGAANGDAGRFWVGEVCETLPTMSPFSEIHMSYKLTKIASSVSQAYLTTSFKWCLVMAHTSHFVKCHPPIPTRRREWRWVPRQGWTCVRKSVFVELLEWRFLAGFGATSLTTYTFYWVFLEEKTRHRNHFINFYLEEPTECNIFHLFVTLCLSKSWFAVDNSYLIKLSPILLKLKLFNPHFTKFHTVSIRSI